MMGRKVVGLLIVSALLVSQPALGDSSAGKGRSSQDALRRATQVVTVTQLQERLLRHLERQLAGKVSEVQVEILDPQEPVTVPAGALQVQVTAAGAEAGLGRRSFQVVLAVDGNPAKTLAVAAEVVALADIVTAARPIAADEIIAADALTVSRIKLPATRHDFITNPEDAVGKRALRPLRPGSPIRLSALAFPYAVRRGDRVTIEAKRGGLLIQAAGLAKAGAQAGQSVTVTNLDSGKQIQAKVVGPGVVQVDF